MAEASEVVPPSTAVADVLALWGLHGWLTPPLQAVVHGTTMAAIAARARTVELRRGRSGFGPLYELLSGDLSGRVLVVSAPDDDVAVWGGLLTLAASQVDAAGVLVAGAVRDVADCRAAGLPLWARAVRTVGPADGMEVAALGEPVTVGSVTVADGDLVVLDVGGVVALPSDGTGDADGASASATATAKASATAEALATAGASATAEAVLADALAYAEAEEQMASALRAGTPLRDAYRLKAEAVASLLAGRRR